MGRGSSDGAGRGVFTVPASCDGLRFRLRDARGRLGVSPSGSHPQRGCVLELPPSLDDSLRFSVRGTASYRDRLLGYMLMNFSRVWTCDTFRVGSGYHKSYLWDSRSRGVNQLTVFDGRGRILCERLFSFSEAFGLRPRFAHRNGPPHAPAVRSACACMLSPARHLLSAMDGGTVFNGRGPSWLTMLSSEVKGYIDNVGYYFESDDSVHCRASDLLMLVQVGGVTDWEELSGYRSRNPEKWHPVEDMLALIRTFAFA